MPTVRLEKKVPKNKLPHFDMCKALDSQVKASVDTFRSVSASLFKELLSIIEKSKLAKSDDFLKRGWSGKVPLIKIDIEKKIAPVIDRYLSVLMYMMLGDYAGKEARENAKDLGYFGKVVPGSVFGAYLQAIDAQRAYFQLIYGTPAPEIQKKLLKESFSVIQSKTDRMISDSLGRYKNRIIDEIENAFQSKNLENLASVQERSHELLEDKRSKAIDKAIRDEVEKKIDRKDLEKALEEVSETYEKAWETNSETLMSMASSAGTHQSMVEVFGANDPKVKAALVNIQDERCCDKCEEFARNPDGSLRLYSLREFKPSGFNFGKKKSEYVLSISPIHHRCRCTVVYVPPGFKIDNFGTIYPSK